MKFSLSFCLSSVLAFSLCYSGVAGFNNPLQNEVLSDNIRSLNLKVANMIRSTENSVKALSAKSMNDMKMFSKIRSVKLMEENNECAAAMESLHDTSVNLQECMETSGLEEFDFESGNLDSFLNTLCVTCKTKMDAVVGAFDANLVVCPAAARENFTDSGGLAGLAEMFGMVCMKCGNTETYLISKILEMAHLSFENNTETFLEELCIGACAAEIQGVMSAVTAGGECDIGSLIPDLYCLRAEDDFCILEAKSFMGDNSTGTDDMVEAAENLANWCGHQCAGVFITGAVNAFEHLKQCGADENGNEPDGQNPQDVVFLLTNMCAYDDSKDDYCLSMAIKDTQTDNSLRELAECASPPNNDTALADRECETECNDAVQAYLTDAGCCAIIEDMFLHPHNFHHRRGFATDNCDLTIPEICASNIAEVENENTTAGNGTSGATSLSYTGSLMVAVIMPAALW